MFAYVARPICLFRYSFADMKVSAARQFSRRIRKDSLSRRSLRASSVEIGPAGVFFDCVIQTVGQFIGSGLV